MERDVKISGTVSPDFARVLTPQALTFLARLHREFGATRETLLQQRANRQAELNAGILPDFLPGTEAIRWQAWQVTSVPPDLEDRQVEITGPVNRRVVVDALNSGASTFKADFEDLLSPTWNNVVQGQINLMDTVRRTIQYTDLAGKIHRLREDSATLIVRPRGWHLVEKHVLVDNQPISGSLFDFGLYFFHNAHALLNQGTGPYFYLPKLEGHLEARLWNDIFNFAQDALNIPRGTIRASIIIETILAVFEMDEILHELRDHAIGLNAGRWDYIFSLIKKLRTHPAFVLPDRAQVTMTLPFMRAYTELLVKTSHRRGAHAIGGMSAFIPDRDNSAHNQLTLARVREDKEREVQAGFDGAWVAHPDLVPVVKSVFEQALGSRLHQKERLRDEIRVTGQDLLNVRIPDGRITRAGLHYNVSVILQYLESWLRGTGAVAIQNLIEDVATAEIARTQFWQWIHHGRHLDSGELITGPLYQQIRTEELARLNDSPASRYREAAAILDELILGQEFVDFLTIPAYSCLE